LKSTFSQRITRLRKENRLSQKDAANSLGISQALLSHYENGIRKCTFEFLLTLCEFYHVTTDYILGKSDSRMGLVGETVEDSDALNFSAQVEITPKTLHSYIGAILESIEHSCADAQAAQIYRFLLVSAYRALLATEKAGNVDKNVFGIDRSKARALAASAMLIEEADIYAFIPKGLRKSSLKAPDIIKKLTAEAEKYIFEKLLDQAGSQLSGKDAFASGGDYDIASEELEAELTGDALLEAEAELAS
jgi:transcriptional regulator with XRE-family HTH domain